MKWKGTLALAAIGIIGAAILDTLSLYILVATRPYYSPDEFIPIVLRDGPAKEELLLYLLMILCFIFLHRPSMMCWQVWKRRFALTFGAIAFAFVVKITSAAIGNLCLWSKVEETFSQPTTPPYSEPAARLPQR